MEGYKEVTSAVEGRLFLSTQKHHEADKNNEVYFQSRPHTLPTADSWLSPFASRIDTSGKSKSSSLKDGDQSLGTARTKSHRSSLRSAGKGLPKIKDQEADQIATTSDAFTVTVELAEPILYLEGFDFPHNVAHRSAVIRGSVHLKILRPTTLSHLTLTFLGTHETIWPEAWRVRRLKKVSREEVVHHLWNFLHHDKSVGDSRATSMQKFAPGQYSWNFELPLASSLPETIDLPLGKVSYTLRASATEAGHSFNTATFLQNITLLRIPCVCSLELTEPYEVRGLLQGLRYSFSLAAKSCRVGGQLPLTIKLSSPTDRSWQSINVSMVEDIQYRTRDGQAHREQSRVKAVLYTKRAKRDPLHQRALRRISAAGEKMAPAYASGVVIEKHQPRRSGSVSHLEDADMEYLHERAILSLPSCSKIEADTAYKCLYVRHHLLITIAAYVEINEYDRKHFQIRIRMPIQIITCKLCDGNATLPEYSESPAALTMEGTPDLCRCASGSRNSLSENGPATRRTLEAYKDTRE
ncbi:hypothetical protein LTR67_005021 [Exophiala xenobiotica]